MVYWGRNTTLEYLEVCYVRIVIVAPKPGSRPL